MKNNIKMSRILLFFFVFTLSVLFFESGVISTKSAALANNTLNFQSKIVNKINGTNISAPCINAGIDTCDFQVRIYDSPSGGMLLF
ncbi:hypothetical protein D6810_01045 [Candidatus Dojkabacteria bacterium]|uniref:Uncharacterized protein n=1 Tax=Candidatus Dojkabacteria bacterium TaxID=2099670 RepID=A0A3M0Z0W3_9BACT|nr:MAG: hypothetical protein D6810_01045 [Candidatus Dojkabacteria bacterium]